MIHEKDIDYALNVSAHPELESTEEFKRWIQDAAHKQLYLDIQAAHDGLAQNEWALPNVQEEWARFCQRMKQSTLSRTHRPTPKAMPRRKQAIVSRSTFWRVVTIILLVAGVNWGAYMIYRAKTKQTNQSVALMKHQEFPVNVTLTTTDGHTLAISQETNRDSLASLGTALCDSQRIAYNRHANARHESYHTLSTPRGKDFKIILSDGTEVWLNAESTLKYPAQFRGEQRVVELTGEAYFHVATDETHPFIVKAKDIETQVIGTSFNFRNYDYCTPHVTLVEGKLLVTGFDTSVILNPNENAQFNPDGTIRVTQVDTRSYTAWTNGYFYFDNSSLEEIMREIGRWYNLTIQFQNTAAMNYHFTFWAKRTEDIEVTLRLINGLGKVRTTLNDNILTIQ